MTQSILEIIQSCEWFPSHFLVISENVFSPLLYYSYFGAAIPALMVGFLIYLNNRKRLENKLLFLTIISFVLWIFGALVTWATEFPKYTMFFWTFINLIEPFVYFFAFYFSFVFFFKKDFSVLQKIIFSIPLLPIIIFASTKFSLIGYNLSNCDRNAYEGILASYGYALEIIYALSIIIIAIIAFRKIKDQISRREIILVTIGTSLFLLSFSLGNILEVFTENWYIGQYGLFGAPIFMAFLAFIIVRFKAFDIKLIGAKALVWSLVIIIGSEFFFVKTNINRILTAITLILSAGLGYMIIRSIKKEVALREKVEEANAGQKNLIHIMNHQIKGYLSIDKNIFAELLTDDYGKVPAEATEIIKRGLESSDNGQKYVSEILKGASAESGTLVYDMKLFDFGALVSGIVLKEKEVAEKKGLRFTSNVSNGNYNIVGDCSHLSEAMRNLMENSINYTPKGEISTNLKLKDSKIVFSIKDTGVGIKDEDRDKMFKAGGVSASSIKINTNSSGYGLAYVKGVVEAHKGRVWFESDGEDKGSVFFVELPVK